MRKILDLKHRNKHQKITIWISFRLVVSVHKNERGAMRCVYVGEMQMMEKMKSTPLILLRVMHKFNVHLYHYLRTTPQSFVRSVAW